MITANSRHDTGQLRKVKACELSSLKSVDVFAGRLAAVVQRSGDEAKRIYPHVRIVRSIEELLGIETIRLVVIATPNQTHFPLAMQCLEEGRDVAYLTLGDPMTYSTYGYTMAALRDRLPTVHAKTIPGITSFAAAAAAMNWPIGEGKERVLILPCPYDPQLLRQDIESHDVVVLMKIGKRLPMVLQLLRDLGIGDRCALAKRAWLPPMRKSGRA